MMSDMTSPTFTFDELMDKVTGKDCPCLDLSFEDAIAVQKILVKRGYAVMMTAADFDDEYRISWIYAGEVGSLNYANSENVIFCEPDYINMLAYHEYKDEDNEEYNEE